MSDKITEIWAFIIIDPANGSEVLPAFSASNGTMIPLVAADHAQIDALRPIAREIATHFNTQIVFKRFSAMTIEETIEPASRSTEALDA